MFGMQVKDKLAFIKKDGQTLGIVDAHVSSNVVYTDNVALPYAVGDVFERSLPSGVTERLVIEDPEYCKPPVAHSNIKPYFQIKVRKEGVSSRTSTPHTVNYNLQGTNSRVNVNSVDQSINVANVDCRELIREFRQAVQDNIDSEVERTKLLDKTEEFENAQSTSTLMKKYSELMELAADHVAVLPCVVKLGKWIAGIFQ